MNRRSQTTQNDNAKDYKKVPKSITINSCDFSDDHLPDFPNFSFKTGNTTAECGFDISESNFTKCMKLRSRARRTINPFDLSSDCGDSDFLENKYSLRSKGKQSGSKSSSLTTDFNSESTGDMESLLWSELDSFSKPDEISGNYEYYQPTVVEKNPIEPHYHRNHPRNSVSESDSEESDRKKPKLAFTYELRQRHNLNYRKPANQPSPLPLLSTSNHSYIPEISNQTLADLLIGRYSCYLSEYSIIDCRFPYEYEGGHINNSVNVYTCRQLLQFLNRSVANLDLEQEVQHVLKSFELPNPCDNFQTKAFIFYCEFSSFRGPKLAECLRGLDRLANAANHPRLKFPHVFVVHGGFNEFFVKFPHLCTPEGYVSMKQTRYSLRSPINPYLGPTVSTMQHGNVHEPENLKILQVLSPKLADPVTSIIYRKQQINCQRQLKMDAKRLIDIVGASTKNSDIIRFFKFDEIF